MGEVNRQIEDLELAVSYLEDVIYGYIFEYGSDEDRVLNSALEVLSDKLDDLKNAK